MAAKKPIVLSTNIELPDGSMVDRPHFFVVVKAEKDKEEVDGKMITHSKNGVSKRKTDHSEFVGFVPDEESYITTGICKTNKNNIKKDKDGKSKIFGWFFS